MENCIMKRQVNAAAALGLRPSAAKPTERCGERTREGGERKRRGPRGSVLGHCGSGSVKKINKSE